MRGEGVRPAVLAGGALGSLGRWLVGAALPAAGPGWGWATIAVNLSGALAMGLLVAWLASRSTSPLLRPFVAVGLLGGWTTYSTLALDVHATAVGDGPGSALGYVVVTIVAGIGASLAGLLLGGRWFGAESAAADEVVDEEEP